MSRYNIETYEKLLEDVEDYLVGADWKTDSVMFRVRDMLREIIASNKAVSFKLGDIVSDGSTTLILLNHDVEWRLVIAYCALKNKVIHITESDLVHFHKVGHMSPIKITIHNEEEK